MKKITLILAGMLVTAMFFAACAPAIAPAQETAAPETTAEETDDGLLSFSFTTLTGDTLDQTVFSDNKLIMVNYWATWCGPCVSEIPDLVKISNDYADKGLAIIGVNVDTTDADSVKKFVEDQNITYPVIFVDGVFLNLIQGYEYIPTTLFFDSTGRQIGEAVVGSNSYDDWVDEITQRLLQLP